MDGVYPGRHGHSFELGVHDEFLRTQEKFQSSLVFTVHVSLRDLYLPAR